MLRKLLQGLRSLRKGDQDPDWQYDERRELVRMRCHYDVEYRFRDKRHKGQIVDMSLGGMKLRCFQPPLIGETVEVTYKVPSVDSLNQTVPCKVQWVRARDRDYVQFVGLAYDAPDEVLRRSWVKMLLKQLGFQPDKIFQRRRYVRAECVVPVRVVYQRVNTFDGRLYNLGVKGALVEGQTPLEPGELVELQVGPFEDLPFFSIMGKVAQQTNHHKTVLVGVEFTDVGDRNAKYLGQYLHHLLLNHWEA